MFTVISLQYKDAEQKCLFIKTLIRIVIMISGSWDGDIVSVEGDMRGSWWSGGAGGAAGGGGMGSLFLVPPVERKISAN